MLGHHQGQRSCWEVQGKRGRWWACAAYGLVERASAAYGLVEGGSAACGGVEVAGTNGRKTPEEEIDK